MSYCRSGRLQNGGPFELQLNFRPKARVPRRILVIDTAGHHWGGSQAGYSQDDLPLVIGHGELARPGSCMLN